MSSEIEVPETPNWLQELEAKRERRLKAKLGHEAGAGAPCLKCGEKCPGLDLHFWRKCCKICKCAKEEHEIQDDDIYGWAQFQLLGNKPNKIKRTIKLPGKKDEVELDWIPKGHNDTVDKYLKTLPPDQLPVRGSQAAQDRKQLLHKQIPVHDIDPTLCHELSNEELKQMNDYVAHVKQTSVGVGQIVSLSNIIKAYLHMLNPSEAALIASRYPKGIPLSEIVKLQAQSRANALSQRFDKINLQDSGKVLPNVVASSLNTTEETLSPSVGSKIHDVNYIGYGKSADQALVNAQFTGKLKPEPSRGYVGEPALDERFLQNPNFDPKNIPSQFLHQNALYGQPFGYKSGPNEMLGYKPVAGEASSAFVPYNKVSTGAKFGDKPVEGNYGLAAKYSSSNESKGLTTPATKLAEASYVEDLDPLNPNFAKNLAKYPSGFKNPTTDEEVENFATAVGNNGSGYENVEELKKSNKPGLPSYAPSKYNVFSEQLSPSKIPRSVKDLAFSTYDPNNFNVEGFKDPGLQQNQAMAYEHYPQGYFENISKPYNQDSSGAKQVTPINVPSGQYTGSNERYPPAVPPNTAPPPIPKTLKKLSELLPGHINVEEDFLHPSQVTIGAIQDINYPEIKAATQGTNDFYEDYSPDSLREILNNVKLPDCHYCKKPFEENEFAITIDRANVLFHAQCFKCAGCNQILADNVYFYNKETDNVYCGRDYAKIRGFPRCKACDELIFTKEYCLAENSTFHLKHFCCMECDRPLAGQDYTLEDEMPYCLPCFEQSKANKCSSCGRPIKPDEVGCNLNGVHFHAVDECFACKICRKPLMGKKLLLRNEKLYCSHDCFGVDKQQ